MTRSFPLLVGAFAAVATAETTAYVSFMMPDWDGEYLSASVVGVEGAATTLAVGCKGITLDWKMCDSNPKTIVGGPSTLSINWVDRSAHLYDDVLYTRSQDIRCDIYPEQSTATCTSTDISVIDGKRTTSVTIEPTSRPDYYFYPVAITAGLEKLDGKDDDETTTIPTTTAQPQSTSVETTASETSSEVAVETSSELHIPSEPVVPTQATTPSKVQGNDTAKATSTSAPSNGPGTPVEVSHAIGLGLAQSALVAGLFALVGGAAMLL
ncbi:Hypothetical protein NCS54_00941400 [Fusarium falciforme]|uniref:Hypothetical protein n=1 Tax=Fusarium falciforme TaxID=195108 RepID=UPI00230054CF|nr:Hypothetical protein NCS54_00941400 [Fusarium falciforme]WAO91929.1 Hypothetical protein NCS54_00941400 [Fusarium falciforme]